MAGRPVIAKQTLWKPPHAGLQINWQHPQARNLRMAMFFTEYGQRRVRDIAMPGRAGILPAGMTWKGGRFGSSIQGSATAAQLGTFNTNIVMAGTGTTFECMYFHGANFASFAGVLTTTGNAGFGIDSTNKWGLDNTGTGDGATTMTVGQWYHAVIVINSAAPNNFYLNGKADGTENTSGVVNNVTYAQWIGDGFVAQPSAQYAWMRLWERALSAGEVARLYAAPFDMLMTAGNRRTMAVMAGATAGAFISGAPTFISNSALVESAQLLEPSTVQANSLVAESAQLKVATAAEIANSLIVETFAQLDAPATEQSNSLIAESVQIREPSTVQANSALAESAQMVTPSGTVPVQANSAAALPTAQVVNPVIAVQSNSLLAVTGGLAGQGGGSVIANSVLAETAAQVLAPATEQANSTVVETAAQITSTATVQANSVLTESVQVKAATAATQSNSLAAETVGQIVAPAIVQANSLLSVTGGIAGGGTVSGSGTLASNSALVHVAQLRVATIAELASALLSVTGTVFNPSAIVMGTVTLADRALHTAVIADTARMSATLADGTTNTATLADSARASATRWRWPEESTAPPSPICES